MNNHRSIIIRKRAEEDPFLMVVVGGGDSNKNVSVMNSRHLICLTKTDVGSLGQKSE